jgi:hypothetical protein
MPDNEIIKAWQAGNCEARAEFIAYIREAYGNNNLLHAVECEDKA